MWATDQMRSLLFHHLLSQHPVLPYAGGFLTAAFPGSSPLPWPSLIREQFGSLFSRFRVAISTLQDSLYVAGCYFASLSQGVTTLRHSQSPDCTGCLLRGLLSATTTGLAPASKRCLSGHTTDPYERICRIRLLSQVVTHRRCSG